MGRHTVPINEIYLNGHLTTDHQEIAHAFSEFFSKKITDLCSDRIDQNIIDNVVLQKPKVPLKITHNELGIAIKSLSNKKVMESMGSLKIYSKIQCCYYNHLY